MRSDIDRSDIVGSDIDRSDFVRSDIDRSDQLPSDRMTTLFSSPW